jgi:hypothetical protein
MLFVVRAAFNLNKAFAYTPMPPQPDELPDELLDELPIDSWVIIIIIIADYFGFYMISKQKRQVIKIRHRITQSHFFYLYLW